MEEEIKELELMINEECTIDKIENKSKILDQYINKILNILKNY